MKITIETNSIKLYVLTELARLRRLDKDWLNRTYDITGVDKLSVAIRELEEERIIYIHKGDCILEGIPLNLVTLKYDYSDMSQHHILKLLPVTILNEIFPVLARNEEQPEAFMAVAEVLFKLQNRKDLAYCNMPPPPPIPIVGLEEFMGKFEPKEIKFLNGKIRESEFMYGKHIYMVDDTVVVPLREHSKRIGRFIYLHPDGGVFNTPFDKVVCDPT